MVKSLKPLFAPIEVPSFVDDKSSVPVADVAAPSSPTSMALDQDGASDSDYALQYLSSEEALAMLKFTMQCDFNVQVCLMPLYKELIDAVYADITSHSVSLQTSSSQSLLDGHLAVHLHACQQVHHSRLDQ